jgi:hypothetical protein
MESSNIDYLLSFFMKIDYLLLQPTSIKWSTIGKIDKELSNSEKRNEVKQKKRMEVFSSYLHFHELGWQHWSLGKNLEPPHQYCTAQQGFQWMPGGPNWHYYFTNNQCMPTTIFVYDHWWIQISQSVALRCALAPIFM